MASHASVSGAEQGDVDGRPTEKSVQEKIPGTGRSSCAGENPTTAIETEKGETGIRGSDGRDAACGLTETGRNFVTEMERLGMIPDVSHLSDAGFDDVWECTKKPSWQAIPTQGLYVRPSGI